jgi:hypothetical protein
MLFAKILTFPALTELGYIEATIIAEQRGLIGNVEEEEYTENEQLRAAFLKRMKRFEMIPIQVFNHQLRQIGQRLERS